MVEGVITECSESPLPLHKRQEMVFSQGQCKAVDGEIEELLKKEVIVACKHTEGIYISHIIVRPKKNNKLRMILNLKNLTGSVENHHFKMETLKLALALVEPNCFSRSSDLRDAYFSVHSNDESQNFLKFEWG